MYCLCVNVYRTTATGCQNTIAVNKYINISIKKYKPLWATTIPVWSSIHCFEDLFRLQHQALIIRIVQVFETLGFNSEQARVSPKTCYRP